MKKFYNLVAVAQQKDGYAVLLDGRPVKTPGGRPLLYPNETIANLVMAEWVAQGEEIKPETMPLSQIMVTYLDKTQYQRSTIHDEIMNYFDTDLLCYRAADPPAFAERQRQRWDPVLAWFEGRFGEKLATTTEIAPISQSPEARQQVDAYVAALPDPVFNILQITTADTGSLILALALLEGSITPEEAFAAAQVEELLKSEIYHEEIYGRAPDVEKKQTNQLLGLHAARDFLAAL